MTHKHRVRPNKRNVYLWNVLFMVINGTLFVWNTAKTSDNDVLTHYVNAHFDYVNRVQDFIFVFFCRIRTPCPVLVYIQKYY